MSSELTSVDNAGALDSSLRRLLQNPRKVLAPYIREGMTVLDLGCGSGYFTIETAKLLSGSGKVIAADLQQGMLDIVRQKIDDNNPETPVHLHKCSEDSINLDEKADFILAFYAIHEAPNQSALFRELSTLLKPEGKILIAEPKFHVPKHLFHHTVHEMTKNGFVVIERPKVFLSRAVLMELQQ